MLFNSYLFILVFLPLIVMGYFILNKFRLQTVAQIFVLGMSLWFYGYFSIFYLVLMLASVGMNYLVYRQMELRKSRQCRRLLLVFGLIFNLSFLFYYKYLDFLINNINMGFHKDYPLLRLVLPLGISFFTFQQISFIIDAYNKRVPMYSLLYYASFVTFFPQLIAGPIVTHDELIPQFIDEKKKRINWDNIAKGIYIFTIGMFKKVILADTFGNAVNWGFQNIAELDTSNALIVMLAYTMQIYFDFSGYCDMALGIGKMLNIELPLNFNSPYKALRITEFWDRWHITLTRFLTKYVYIPLGGNRRGRLRTYFNILIVFLISGIWHGANWTFILWGGGAWSLCNFNKAF